MVATWALCTTLVCALLLAGTPTTRTACTSKQQQLTTSCDDACGSSNTTCVVYHSPRDCPDSAYDSGYCTSPLGSDCTYKCFAAEGGTESAVLIFITGGAYEDDQALEGSGSDVEDEFAIDLVESFDQPVFVLGPTDDVNANYDQDAFAKVASDEIEVVGPLDDSNTVSSVHVAGHYSDYPVKGHVANVTIVEDCISERTTDVRLTSLNIGRQLEKSLATYMPATISYLDISNTMLTAVPRDLGNFTSIHTLRLDQNNIVRFPATLKMSSLKRLSLRENGMKEFDGQFENLESLRLDVNAFTSIPPVVFSLKNLKELDLRNNSFEQLSLTMKEFDFINSIDHLAVSGPFKTECANPRKLTDSETNAKIAVCIEERTTKSHVGMIVGIAVALIAVAVIVGIIVWRRRQSTRKTSLDLPLSPLYHEAPPSRKSMPMAASDVCDAQSTRNTMPTTDHSTSNSYGRKTSGLTNDPVLSMYRMEVDDIRDLRQLGKGGYGVVWLVSFRAKQMLASKRLRVDTQTNQEQVDKFLDEIRLTARLQHPNIVQFVGVAWTRLTDVQALFEYMENGDLRNWLKHSDPAMGWTRTKMQIAINIIEALVCVHSFSPPIVHRDLKSSNVLLDKDLMAKLCDFGVSRVQTSHQTMTVGVGTSLWLAPEVIKGHRDYGCPADVYAFGVLLSELDTHKIPYQDVRSDTGNRMSDVAIIHQVGLGKLKPTLMATCPPDVETLADWCLEVDPEKRPTAMEVSYGLSTIMKGSNFQITQRNHNEAPANVTCYR